MAMSRAWAWGWLSGSSRPSGGLYYSFYDAMQLCCGKLSTGPASNDARLLPRPITSLKEDDIVQVDGEPICAGT